MTATARKPKRLMISACAGAAAVAIACAGSASAFSISSISGLFEDFAPFIDNVLGVDISPYLDKIQSSSGFAEAIISGNWGKASALIGGAMGEYGVIDPRKLKEAILGAAKQKYSTTSAEDFGLGSYGSILNEQMSTKESLGGIQSEVNMGEEAQKSWSEKGEALAETVQSSSKISTAAAKERNSLNVLKGNSNQLTALTSVVGQGVSETKSNGRSLFRIEDTLNDIRTADMQDSRSKMRSLNDSTAASTGSAGTYAGMLSGQSSEEENR
jgi:hypothetical protein